MINNIGLTGFKPDGEEEGGGHVPDVDITLVRETLSTGRQTDLWENLTCEQSRSDSVSLERIPSPLFGTDGSCQSLPVPERSLVTRGFSLGLVTFVRVPSTGPTPTGLLV